MPRSFSRISSATMSLTSELDRPGHRLVGDQQLGLGRHGAGEFELAHVDLGEVPRTLPGAVGEADHRQQLRAALADLGFGERGLAPGIDGVEQRNPQVVGDRHAGERPRQLEAAGKPEPGALMGGEPGEIAARKPHLAGLVDEGAAQAVDQRALARAVGADQADPLARRHREIDGVERDEAAEPLGETRR